MVKKNGVDELMLLIQTQLALAQLMELLKDPDWCELLMIAIRIEMKIRKANPK